MFIVVLKRSCDNQSRPRLDQPLLKIALKTLFSNRLSEEEFRAKLEKLEKMYEKPTELPKTSRFHGGASPTESKTQTARENAYNEIVQTDLPNLWKRNNRQGFEAETSFAIVRVLEIKTKYDYSKNANSSWNRQLVFAATVKGFMRRIYSSEARENFSSR